VKRASFPGQENRIVTHFQVPDGRVFHSSNPRNTLKPWPETADGYRLFVTGALGDEKIGIELHQAIGLQLTGGKDCNLLTKEMRDASTIMDVSVSLGSAVQANPGPIALSRFVATDDKQKFDVIAMSNGATVLYATDPAGNSKAALKVVVGHFENHPGMQVDLIADVCRGSDSFKIHGLQRMLHNQYVGYVAPNYVYTNGDNVFEQHAPPNKSLDSTIGTMSCGVVARFRTEEIFPKSVAPPDNWYKIGAVHEPLSGPVTDRKQVKYRSAMIETLRGQILRALKNGQPVLVGVVDSPVGMRPENGDLVAYNAGGHTVVIVGCSNDGKEFLYIDPWGGGSKMEYKGGIVGNRFDDDKCSQIGKFIVAYDPDRRVKQTDTANKIIRQHPDTQGSFSYSGGNYLEVVSAAFTVAGRR
jgi:hypothetical protein